MQLAATLLYAALSIVLLVSQVAGNSAIQDRLYNEASRSSDGVIELDESNYDAFLAAPRDFSVTVLYTALHVKFNCAACKMFEPSYKQVALGWRKKKSSKKHVFAYVEAARALNVIRKVSFFSNPRTALRMCLSFTTSPSLLARLWPIPASLMWLVRVSRLRTLPMQ